jgi:hypothetical protein
VIYVVLPRDRIGEVMRGELTQLPVTYDTAVGQPLDIKTSPDADPTCRVEIVTCEPDPDGYTLTIRPWVYEHEPRLLRAGSPLTGGGKARLMSGRKRRFKDVRAKEPDGRQFTEETARGYTDRPEVALQDAGEAVPAEFQDHLTMRALARDENRKRKQSLAAKRDRALLTVVERIDLARQAARANHIDIGTDLTLLRRSMRERRSDAAITRRLEDIERRAHRDAA